MHEYHIIKTLVDDILAKNSGKAAKKIKSITVAIGELSGFDAETVKMYFSTLSENTILQDAEIKIKSIPSTLHCKTCAKDFERKNRSTGLNCPICGAQGMPNGTAKELFVDAIETE